MKQKRGIIAEDLYELKSVGGVELTPDGSHYAYVQTQIDREKHEYMSHVFVGDVKGGEQVQWTFGNARDTSPKWSPDGSCLAFVSNRTGQSQLYIINANGGEAKQITFCKNGARNPIWSPDSSSILFATYIEINEDVIDVDKKQQQLAIINIETLAITQIIEGQHDYTPGCWSPDGSQIVFSADLTDELDFQLVADVYIMDLTDKKMKKLTNSNGYFGNTTWSPDGHYIAMIGHEKEYDSATLSRIWVYDVKNEHLSCLTTYWDVEIGDVAIGDFHSGNSNPGIVWTEDSHGFYFIMSDHGNTGVYYGTLEGEMYPSLLENQHVYCLSVDSKNHKAIVGISTPTHPGDLYSIDLSTGELKQLTYVNDDNLLNIELSAAEPFTCKAPDGWDIHGWVMKPIGFEEGKQYPTIIEVHGGTQVMFANSYFHEFQVLAAKGFAVVYTNPRGSFGYGQEFIQAALGDNGRKDYLDVMAATKYVEGNFCFVEKHTARYVHFLDANHELSKGGNPKLRIDRLNHIKDWFVEYLG
ncbi:alpha/beta hydrolase family protein [Bacillus sp. PS06]|uniref:S9 family peptidase n=1 Tax=Bacillus sp. PS06 TaxID=2764176 RepID=UPI001781494E|nr:S9 family peptidase [Bacillus sp. PS06]MBD8067609.1 S9 family peptidase [Bacillus sp. PS06]